MGLAVKSQIPGLDPEANRALVEVQTAIARECQRLEDRTARPKRRVTELVEAGAVIAKPGQVVRVQPSDTDITVYLPEPGPLNGGEDVVVSFEGDGTATGKVLVAAVGGTCSLPGVTTLNSPGQYRYTSVTAPSSKPGYGSPTPSTGAGTTWSGPPPIVADDLPDDIIYTDTLPGAPVYDVLSAEFGAVGDGVTDDGPAINLAIAVANASPGVIALGSNHRIATALTAITANAVWVRGRGDGFLNGTQIYIDIAGTSASGFTFSGGQYQGISDCYFRSGKIYTSECYAVELTGGFCQFARNIRVDHHWGAIRVMRAAEARLSHIGTRYLVGSTGICFTGVSSTQKAYRCIIDTALLDQPPPTGYAATVAGNGTPWATSTAYGLGQFTEANGNLYQCTSAGTSSGAGSGPSGFGTGATDPGTAFSNGITDGSCTWKFCCKSDFTHMLQANYAYTFVITKVATLNGVYPLRMTDAANTGSSLPAFCFVHLLETDHNWRGIKLEAGQAAHFEGCSLGACLADSGVVIGPSFSRDWSFVNCEMFGCCLHGFDVDAGDGIIASCYIGNNGQLTANTYNGIDVAASLSKLTISGNHSLNTGTSQKYGCSIASGCTNYIVVGNNFQGNATGGVNNVPGYASTRVVAWNLPETGLVDAMVATGAAITTDKLAALTGEVTKPSGSTATTVVRSTDFTWTGKHSFGSHFILGTQQNYTGSLGGDIGLNNTTNRLYVLVNGTGDVQTITPASGTTDIGRCVIAYIVGSGTKTLKNNFSGGGVGRLLCPGNADLAVTNRDAFLMVGDGSNGWLIMPFKSGTTTVPDADYGDITVSGGTWTIDPAAVTPAKISDRTAMSVFGRASNTSGVGADIVATSADAGFPLRVNAAGTALIYSSIGTLGIDDGAVTNAKAANMAQATIKGRASGAGTGAPTDLTATQTAVIVAPQLASSSVTLAGGGQTLERAALVGDVTASVNSNTTTIAADAVTNTKLANMTDSTLKGRASGAGTGDPDDLTAREVSTILSQADARTLASIVTRINSTTDSPAHANFSVAANDWQAGTTFVSRGHLVMNRGSTATAVGLTIFSGINGGYQESQTISLPTPNGSTVIVTAESVVTCFSTGGSGTIQVSLRVWFCTVDVNGQGATVQGGTTQVSLHSLDTTTTQQVIMRAFFTAAVASTDFTWNAGWINRVNL